MSRGSLTALAGWVRANFKSLLLAILVLAVVVFISKLAFGDGDATAGREPTSDTAPAEFLYLDNVRVRAYLGQALGGLSDTQKRTLSSTANVAGKVAVGPVEASGSKGRENSIEETVTPQTTDLLLGLLEYLQSHLDPAVRLQDIDARTRLASRAPLGKRLFRMKEGDFVRLEQAHLFLPPFAALMDRARSSAAFRDGKFLRRNEALSTPELPEPDRAAYVADLIKQDPQLPFLVPMNNMRGAPIGTFFIPARYSALLDNPRLLAGNLTVVGKVIFIERRFADDPHCRDRSREPCTHTDSVTAQAFGPALARLKTADRDALGIPDDQDPTAFVADQLTFRGPFVVVLPVAIYQ